jgi:hypothetical protein
MKVHIEDNIYLESDERQFIIKKYTGSINKQTNQEVFVPLGYYSQLESVVKALVRMKIRQSSATTFEELIQDLKRIEEWIKSKIDY